MSDLEIDNIKGEVKDDVAYLSFSTTFAHRIFLLVATAFLLFELMFLWFYSNRSWFAVDIIPWSVPTALAAMISAHILLGWLETKAGCQATSFISKGLPVAPYQRWVEV